MGSHSLELIMNGLSCWQLAFALLAPRLLPGPHFQVISLISSTLRTSSDNSLLDMPVAQAPELSPATLTERPKAATSMSMPTVLSRQSTTFPMPLDSVWPAATCLLDLSLLPAVRPPSPRSSLTLVTLFSTES